MPVVTQIDRSVKLMYNHIMEKSKIVKELANNEVEVDVALKQLLVLATDFNDAKLRDWAHNELYGYEDLDELPDYRLIENLNLTYSGFRGNLQITNQPLPMSYLKPATKSRIKINKILEPVSNIIGYSHLGSGKSIVKDRTDLAYEIYERTGGDYNALQCVSITQNFDASVWARILNKLNVILLEIFMKLDKEYGNLDNLDIDITKESEEKIEKTKSEVHQIIFKDCTFNNNSKNVDKSKVKNSNIANSSDNAKLTTKEDKRKAKSSVIGGKENRLEKKTEINAKAKFDL